MTRKIFTLAFCVALFAAIQTPAAWAINEGPTMMITIEKGPVEIPGRVLQPGTYEFSYVDVYRHVVDVRTADGAHIGYFEVLPAERVHNLGKDRVDLRPVQGAPERIKDFFFRGETYGSKFLYPSQDANVSVSSHAKLRP